MSFKYYDLLSNLVPGLLISGVVYICFGEKIPHISEIILLAMSFIMGYLNNTISSWLEGFYRFLWGGNPINAFFNGTGIFKVRFFKGNAVKKILSRTVTTKNPSDIELFTEAMRIANDNSTTRLEDFNSMYAFSRAVLTAFLISGVMVIYTYYQSVFAYLGFIILFLISLVRCKQRNGYYVREVLNIVLKLHPEVSGKLDNPVS